MAKREGLNTMEMGQLAQELKATGDWNAAKAIFPQVSGDVLDKGFKAWAFKAAGLDLAKYEAAEKAKAAEAAKAKAADPLK